MLEKEIEEVESALYHWQKARQWVFDNPTIITDRDRRDVTRKLMKLDVAMDDLHREIPERVVDGDEECPQEFAAALIVYLKAASAMIGQDYPLDEATLQAAKVESCYAPEDNEARVRELMDESRQRMERGEDPSLRTSVALQLSDAFEAGYYAAKERM